MQFNCNYLEFQESEKDLELSPDISWAIVFQALVILVNDRKYFSCLAIGNGNDIKSFMLHVI
jgi:hypothetical protein